MSYGILRRLALHAGGNLLGTVTHVETREAVAALTFDDGPDPEYTPKLLEILHLHRARATFFMLGEAAERYPEIVKQVSEAGHAIGNHSWNHPCFPLISRLERRQQLQACAQAIAPHGKRLFRPPYGMQNFASRLDAFLLGYQPVTWSVATDDWLGASGKSLAEQVERQIQPGSVIVLHDRFFDFVNESYCNREPTLEAVRIILDRLGCQYNFVTIPELLRRGQPCKTYWYKAGDIKLLNELRTQAGPGRRYHTNAQSSC